MTRSMSPATTRSPGSARLGGGGLRKVGVSYAGLSNPRRNYGIEGIAPRTTRQALAPLEEIEAELRVSEIAVPKGVTVLEDADELVVKIVHKRELKVEEEIPAVEAGVPAEGEVAAEGEAPAEGEAAETEE